MASGNSTDHALFVSETVPDSESVQKPGRPRCNELDGKTWLRYSVSVWDDIRKTADEAQLGHPAMFPSMLVRRVIEMFLRREQTVVLDPFVGSGSTVVGAMQEGKTGIGFDVSSEYIKKAKARCRRTKTLWDANEAAPEPVLKVADARDLLSCVEPNSVDLCITSPPYWDILKQKRSADYKEIRNYGDREDDLGTIADYDAFLQELRHVFEQVFVAMRPNSYCVVIVMDLRKKNRFFPFHCDIGCMMENAGFIFDDIIIWNRKAEYNNLRPLGYPSVFRVNKIHEFVLLFKTPKADEKEKREAVLLDSS